MPATLTTAPIDGQASPARRMTAWRTKRCTGETSVPGALDRPGALGLEQVQPK